MWLDGSLIQVNWSRNVQDCIILEHVQLPNKHGFTEGLRLKCLETRLCKKSLILKGE